MKDLQQVFLKKIYSKVGKAINDYQLINKDDRIMVGLSGGKDSLALIDLLAGRQKYAGVPFELAAIHIKFSSVPYESDVEYMKTFCKDRGVTFHLISTELPPTANLDESPCFACSWNRRKILFEKTQSLNFNKLALGHHMNDAVETLLLNMFYQGNISALPASLSMFEGKMQLIRPLLLLTQEDLAKYASLRNFHPEVKKCQYEKESKREYVRQILTQLKSSNPEVVQTIFTGMHRIDADYFPSIK